MIKTATAPVRHTGRASHDQAAVRELEQRLHDTRCSILRQRKATVILCVVSATLLALMAGAVVDFFWEMPLAGRALWLMPVATGAAIAGGSAWRRWIAGYSLSRTAADTEGQVREFGQRLRTTLDYEQETPLPAEASSTLLTALHRDAFQVARKTNWDEVVDSRPAFAAFAGAAILCLAWFFMLLAVPELRIASARALLLPWDYTTVEYAPHQATVRVGEAVEITAEVVGRPIASAQLKYREAGSGDDWTVVDLEPSDVGNADASGTALPAGQLLGTLAATLSNLSRDLEFELLAGPRVLPAGSIHVLQPLTIEKSAAHVVPPEYTRRQPETLETLDFKVLEGSTVELRLELNRTAAEARLSASGGPSPRSKAGHDQPHEIPVAIEENRLTVTLLDLRKSATFTLSARAADGMELDPARINIRVQLDRKPEIKFIQPPEELVVNPIAEVPFVVEAEDDISLQKMGVMFQVGSGEMQTLVEQDATGSTEPMRIASTLRLEQFELSFKDAITYYAFAEDDYFGQPRRTTTRLRFIDIRPFKMAFQKVEGGGSCNGCSVTLEELIARQRQNLTLAFAAREQQPLEEGLAEKLAKAESSLLELTREFQEGMEARGALLPALHQALGEMQDAVDSLTEKNIPEAVISEQEALAALILARENVRKLLKQSQSQSASACRKFDREQKQKLRMPEQKEKDRQQQLAQARSKLDDLAKREREWAQQCQSCSKSGSKSGKSASSSQSSQSQQQESSEQQSDRKEGADPQDKPEGSSESRSRAEVAEAQRKMREELAALREEIEKLSAAGKSAAEQGREADRSMQKGLEELEQEQDTAASREGERAARELEELADHLAAMNARDFGQRLDQAGKLARQLADRQARIDDRLKPAGGQEQSSEERASGSKSESPQSDAGTGKSTNPAAGDQRGTQTARDERELAAQAGLLAEQLKALEHEAAAEEVAVRRKLEALNSDNPTDEIAAIMRQAADDLENNRPAQGARGTGQARERLEDLSRALGTIRGEYAQPQLEELLALEEQLAKLMEEARRTGDKSAAQQKWEEIEEKLDRMAAGDKRLEKALRELREGRPTEGEESDAKPGDERVRPGETVAGQRPPRPGSKLRPAPHLQGGKEMPEGHYSWLELGDFSGLRGITKVLQTRIQEAILAGALIDADQPVPPEYKELVEKYYRALSDDLR